MSGICSIYAEHILYIGPLRASLRAESLSLRDTTLRYIYEHYSKGILRVYIFRVYISGVCVRGVLGVCIRGIY